MLERRTSIVFRWEKRETKRTCLRILILSWMGFGNPIKVVESSLIENPTNFFRVCSRNASRSFCRTFGVQGNSFIMNVVVGSILDASLVNEEIDSAELSDDVETNVLPSSSVDDALLVALVAEPSSLAASASKADCLVKLCRFARRALLLISVCPCISKHSAPANGGEIGGIRAMTFAGFSLIGSRWCSSRALFFASNASSRPPRVN